MNNAIQIHPCDTVAVVLRDLEAGEYAAGMSLSEPIRRGHKMALAHIPAGSDIIKYGHPIGIAVRDILPGEWVHSHNLRSTLKGINTYGYTPSIASPMSYQSATFMGYRRADGQVGIRNEVWIVPTVGCVNAIGQEIADRLRESLPSGIDGLTAFTHPYGCSQLGDDHDMTQRALCGLIRHPNAGGVLVLGLGCENNNLQELKTVLGPVDPDRVVFLQCQDHDDEVAAALPLMKRLLDNASVYRREMCDVSSLVVGLKCGGSDGLSGITANPLLGRFTDWLTAGGGTAILTEVPEMFGAEHLLMNRCVNRAIFDKTVRLVNDFKEYFLSHGQPVGENPSPGNREGGITTLEEKSLGCIQKGGMAAITDVLDYGERISQPKLNLLRAPGNDLVASAALAISGAQLVIFTTGRGTPFGCPTPTVKVSSNSELAQRKQHWIDFDAGRLITGTSMDSLADEFVQYILRIASGKEHAKSEALAKNDLAIFKNGVTL